MSEETIVISGDTKLPAKFKFGDRVRKKLGAQWQGLVCGWYSTEFTIIGYAVKSEREKGSVQIYPETALELVIDDHTNSTERLEAQK